MSNIYESDSNTPQRNMKIAMEWLSYTIDDWGEYLSDDDAQLMYRKLQALEVELRELPSAYDAGCKRADAEYGEGWLDKVRNSDDRPYTQEEMLEDYRTMSGGRDMPVSTHLLW